MSANMGLAIIGLLSVIVNYITLYIIFPCRYSKRLSITLTVLFVATFYSMLILTGLVVTTFYGLRGFIHLPLILFLFHGQFFQKTFATFFAMVLSGMQIYPSKAIVGLLAPAGSSKYYCLYIVVLSVFYLIYLFLMYKFGHHIFERMFINGRKTEWGIYSLGALFSIVIMAFFQSVSIPVWVNMTLLVFILWSFAILCFSIINTHEKTRQRYEAEHREHELSEEKALLESLNRTKTEFFGNISHEMKTPLTIIATDIQLAEQFMEEGKVEYAKELMREAWQETMQTANLVTDALIFTRGQEVSKPMEHFDFVGVIKATLAVFEPLVKKQDNTLFCDIAKTTHIYGNADMLASALVNLLSNANRYTHRGTIKVEWGADDGRYRLTVSDNGSGISHAMLPRVFERGVTDGNGTGLGLAIVKNITKLHSGEVTIESEVGKGTSVTLIFPMPEISASLTEEHI